MSMKKAIQEVLLIPYKNEYKKQCTRYESAYDDYIKESERKMREQKDVSGLTCEVRTYEQGFHLKDEKADIVIFHAADTLLSSFARKEICRVMDEKPETVLFYADDDYCEGKPEGFPHGVPASKRAFPFMKPVPSKDSFFSHFYIGGMFAVRTEDVKEVEYPAYETPVMNAYAFALRVWEKAGEGGIYHYSGVLSHRFVDNINTVEESFEGADASFDSVKKDFFREAGIKAELKKDEYGISHVVYPVERKTLVSVLIPSKDNPDVLKKCVDSLLNINTYEQIEIIIIDNGSTEENRQKVFQYADDVNIQNAVRDKKIKYLYSPQEFNYSCLNNLMAKEADGEVLLLLNDDMEIKSPFAIERMLGQALMPKTGAVGAKLLYPDSTRIQHVGITNAVDGPVHKFIGMDDKCVLHHGRNRLVHDCLAVTGACLMVRKELYEKLGGLNEELKVAYNDVDFCFRLMETGYSNVIRNDCVLYHHESLSRGTDVLSEEKMERLKKERKLLYSIHRDFYHNDPYEGAMISGGAELSFDMESRFDKPKLKSEKPKVSKRDYHRYPGGIHVAFDRLEKEEFERSNGEVYYVLQGFAVIPLIDNVRFTYKMVFEGSKGVTYEMPMKGYLRMNLEGGFPGTEHIRLAGFCNFVTESELPADTYKIGVFAIDHAARRRLYQDTGRTLVVDGE